MMETTTLRRTRGSSESSRRGGAKRYTYIDLPSGETIVCQSDWGGMPYVGCLPPSGVAPEPHRMLQLIPVPEGLAEALVLPSGRALDEASWPVTRSTEDTVEVASAEVKAIERLIATWKRWSAENRHLWERDYNRTSNDQRNAARKPLDKACEAYREEVKVLGC